MEINRHICFCDKEVPQLIRYLEKQDIAYERDEELSSLDILESNPHWKNIKKLVAKYNLLCLSETVFSEEERQNAEWLEVRSQWHYDYPQPEDRYQATTYSQQDYCPVCGQGLTQISAFRIRKSPTWGKRHFFMLNWIEDELFVDEQAKALLEREFPFLSFREVANKSGVNTLSDVFQIVIPSMIENSIIEKQNSLRKVIKCRCCRKKKYHPTGIGMTQYKREGFENMPDMFKTAEWFGWGCGASHRVIISRKMYRFILDNQLGRSLVFSPINLVD